MNYQTERMQKLHKAAMEIVESAVKETSLISQKNS